MGTFSNGIRTCVNPKAKYLCNTLDNVLYNIEKSDRSLLAWQTCRANIKNLNNRKINSRHDVPLTRRVSSILNVPCGEETKKDESLKAERKKNVFYQLLKASEDVMGDNGTRSYTRPFCTTRQSGGNDNNDLKDDRIFNDIYGIVKAYLDKPTNVDKNPFLLVDQDSKNKIQLCHARIKQNEKPFYPTIPMYKVYQKNKSSATNTKMSKQKPKKPDIKDSSTKSKSKYGEKTITKPKNSSKKQRSQRYNAKIKHGKPIENTQRQSGFKLASQVNRDSSAVSNILHAENGDKVKTDPDMNNQRPNYNQVTKQGPSNKRVTVESAYDINKQRPNSHRGSVKSEYDVNKQRPSSNRVKIETDYEANMPRSSTKRITVDSLYDTNKQRPIKYRGTFKSDYDINKRESSKSRDTVETDYDIRKHRLSTNRGAKQRQSKYRGSVKTDYDINKQRLSKNRGTKQRQSQNRATVETRNNANKKKLANLGNSFLQQWNSQDTIFSMPEPPKKLKDASLDASTNMTLMSPRRSTENSSLGAPTFWSQQGYNEWSKRNTTLEHSQGTNEKRKASQKGPSTSADLNRVSNTKGQSNDKRQNPDSKLFSDNRSRQGQTLGSHKKIDRLMEDDSSLLVNRRQASQSKKYEKNKSHSIMNRSSAPSKIRKIAKKTRIPRVQLTIGLKKKLDKDIELFLRKRKMFSILPNDAFVHGNRRHMNHLEEIEDKQTIETYEERYAKLKHYLNCGNCDEELENINLDGISIEELLLYPDSYPDIDTLKQYQNENQHKDKQQDLMPGTRPVKKKNVRRRKSLEIKHLVKSSPTPPPCCICEQIHRKHDQEDAPFIAEMKKESKRQELKAYLNQMNNIAEQRKLQNYKDNEIIRQTVTVCNGVPHCKMVKYMPKKPILLKD